MLVLLVCAVASFLTTLLLTPYVIRYFRFVGIVTADVHKKGSPLLPSSAGVPVMSGIISGLLLYVFLQVFLYNEGTQLVTLFAAMTSILIITFSGFIDDINSAQVKVAGHEEGKRGLKPWQKPLLTIPAAVPLMAIMAGDKSMSIPLIGMVNFGLFYPLLIVPIGVVGASNMVNMLGGFNGLEAGMGMVYTLSLGLFAYLHGSAIASVVFLTTFASLAAILRYNFYPARILPGDSITYLLGGIVAVGAIIGNIEKAAAIVMIPFIIQGALKFYSRFKLRIFASDLGVLQDDGKVKAKYGRDVYSWTHIVMNLRSSTEREVVLTLVLVEAFFAVIPFLNIL